jgi:hypothetical protein
MASEEQQELIDFLIDSARYGDTDDVVAALKEGVGVDAVDDQGRTGLSLHPAALLCTLAQHCKQLTTSCLLPSRSSTHGSSQRACRHCEAACGGQGGGCLSNPGAALQGRCLQ